MQNLDLMHVNSRFPHFSHNSEFQLVTNKKTTSVVIFLMSYVI